MPDFKKIREESIKLAKQKIKESVTEDNYICHAITTVEELNKVCNALAKRLRDWYALYFPELYKSIADNEAFVRLVLEKDKKTLMAELKIKDSMGKELKEDLEPMKELATKAGELYKLRDSLEKYLEKTMKGYCPNVLALAGALIGAKLLNEAGSLKRLSSMSSSTIQLLGAEKALFRHVRTGAKAPKHGHIVNHHLIAVVKKNEKGKASRALADKISIAAKVDYFKGEFIGDKLKQELEAKFK